MLTRRLTHPPTTHAPIQPALEPGQVKPTHQGTIHPIPIIRAVDACLGRRRLLAPFMIRLQHYYHRRAATRSAHLILNRIYLRPNVYNCSVYVLQEHSPNTAKVVNGGMCSLQNVSGDIKLRWPMVI